VESEFQRLKSLGWDMPTTNDSGLFYKGPISEDEISFPSGSYDGGDINHGANGFWAIQRSNTVEGLLKKHGIKTLWEVGAGNGNMALPLREKGISILPIEPLYAGAITLAKNGFPTFFSTLEMLSLPDGSIEAIGAFDVLEHLEAPEILISEIFRVLKPNGFFVCSVPAYQWLFSDFDLAIGHYRRYSQKSLKTLMQMNNFENVRTLYLFGFLVPASLILRKIPFLLGRRRQFRQVHKSNQIFGKYISILNPLFSLIILIEQKINLRIGLSIISIFVKK